MTNLNQIEQASLCEFLGRPGPVREAIRKFVQQRKQEMDSRAADCLRTVPRQLEQACDAAAKAEVYADLLKDLERFAISDRGR